MAETESKIRINTTPEQLYEVLTDFEAYPRIFTECESMLVLDAEDNEWVVEQTVKVVKTFSFTLALKGEPGKKLEWAQVEGPFKVDEGGWYLSPSPDGGTDAVYRLRMEFGIPVPGSILKTLLNLNLPRMLEETKNEAETRFPR